MRNFFKLFFATILILAACTSMTTTAEPLTTVVTREVTKIVKVTETPFPRYSSTPTLTPDSLDMVSTQIAISIGTPIVAPDCYGHSTTMTTSEFITCSITRIEEMEKQMKTMVEAILKRLKYSPENSEMFLKLQIEWEDLAKRECEFRTGSKAIEDFSTLQGGSSIMVTYYPECLVLKYQDRLRELQREFFKLGQ